MEKTKAQFKAAWGYQQDQMNLPVQDLENALPFYESVMGFQIVSRNDSPMRSALLSRDKVNIGLAENGGDPSQDGSFFEVDDVEAAFEELNANGLNSENPNFRIDKYGETSWKVFFIIAPDGLCYCLGERQI
jgi:lactoylglutathione lyase